MNIPGYPGYKINNKGVVLGKRLGKPLKFRVKNTGYCMVILSNHLGKKMMLIHRLVGFAFVPNPNKYPCVLHRDNNKLNNNHENLFWGTHQMNSEQREKEGRGNHINSKGENHRHKLTQEQVKEIRAYKYLNQKQLGMMYGVSSNQIGLIQRNKSWKH